MIYTVTLNPSLDYLVEVEHFRLGMTNRTTAERTVPGGKGINVSMMLKNLGIPSVTLGFIAGFVGEEIERKLMEMGLDTDFIRLESGCSRINFKLKSVEGTEINGQGPAVSSGAMGELQQKISALSGGDWLFLSGSIPSSVSRDIYAQIMESLQGKGVNVVVDAAGELLLKVLQYHPVFVKPNLQELGELFDTEIDSVEKAVAYGRKLQEMGAERVLISMAGDGAIMISKGGKAYKAEAPAGKLINGVGAGDSMVAGFAAGLINHMEEKEAFCMAVAAGSASAFSEGMGDRELVRNLYDKISCE